MSFERSSKTTLSNVEVNLFGQRLVLKTDEKAAQIEKLAAYVKRKVDDLSARGFVPNNKLAALTALNIAEDYFRLLEENAAFKREVATRSRKILQQIKD